MLLLTTINVLLFSGLCSCFYDYRLIDEPKTWLEAQEYCREKYADLASVDNMDDMKRLIAAAGSGYEGKVWIGLYDKPENWFWTFGNSFFASGTRDFRRWKSGEPNDLIGRGKLCVAVQDGYWLDFPCNENQAFVCYNGNPGGE